MICGHCEADMALADLAPTGGINVCDDIEVRISCPHCEQGYYTFVPASEFVLNEGQPGKKQAKTRKAVRR